MASILSQKNRVPNATDSNAIISKSRNVFKPFCCISRICIKFTILWKKKWASAEIFYLNSKLQIAGLLKYLKSPMSGDLGTVNILKVPKDYFSPNGSLFVIFFIILKVTQLERIGFTSI